MQIALAHYQRQALLARAAAKAAQALWGQVSLSDLDGSWAAVADKADQAVAVAQYAAASAARDYVSAMAEAQGASAVVRHATDPRAFAGLAADGRSLATLLRTGVIRTKVDLARGALGPDAMRSGAASLILAASNEVQQAGRSADSVATAAHPRLKGYTRMLVAPSCSRCAILAGKWFGWNQGFRRHPRCDCIHVPTAEASGRQLDTLNPRDYFNSLGTSEQDRTFGKANAAAIREGANPAKVVNATSTTYVPTGRRAPRQPLRRTPEDIFLEAGADRAKALDLLASEGYLT